MHAYSPGRISLLSLFNRMMEAVTHPSGNEDNIFKWI